LAAESDLVMCDDSARGETPTGQRIDGAGGDDWHILDGATLLAEEMGVRIEVRAIAGGLPVVIDGADEAAFGECFEAIVDGGEGNAGELFLNPQENIHRGGVIVLEKRIINLAPLRGETESLLGDRLIAALAAGLAGGFREHCWLKTSIRNRSLSRTILNKKRERVSGA